MYYYILRLLKSIFVTFNKFFFYFKLKHVVHMLVAVIAMNVLRCTAQKFRGYFTLQEMFLLWKTMLTANVNRKLKK